jgi:hypothetical protein
MKLKKGSRVIVIKKKEQSYLDTYKDLLNCYGIITSMDINRNGVFFVKWFDRESDIDIYKGYFTEEVITLDKTYYRNRKLEEILK